ncbi:PLP-dependent aminotransferase family protein [Hoeflea sp.]|uniref:aminotransferase-like domain-containing protein n=1 Tax=Hoeflea sp. TaxID=1940281 RepID=UPI003B015D88
MQFRIDIDKAGKVGLRDQIVAEISRLIFEGVLQADTKLPSCRKFSQILDVSVNTVIAAYGILEDQHLIYAKPRSGYFVSGYEGARSRERNALETVVGPGSRMWERLNWQRRSEDLRTIIRPENWYEYKYPFVCNQIDEDKFPVSHWRECSRLAMNRKDLKVWSADNHYSDSIELLEQVCTRILPRRGVFETAESVLVTLGSQNGLYIASQLLGGRDRAATMEDPGYPDARKILAGSFGEVRFQPVDDEGLIVDERLRGTTLVFVTPNRQFPTTVTMSERRRKELITVAEAYDFFIVEDDYECDVDYRYFTPFPLRSSDAKDRVIYLGSLSKGLSPGLRLGYLAAAPEFVEAARDLRGTMLRHPPIILQHTAAAFLRFGYYESQLRRLHGDYLARWGIADEIIRDSLPSFDIKGEFGGTNFVLNDHGNTLSASAVAREAQTRGVIIEEIAPCYSQIDIGKFHFRLGVSSIPASSIEPGIKALADSIAVLRNC